MKELMKLLTAEQKEAIKIAIEKVTEDEVSPEQFIFLNDLHSEL